MLREYFEYYLLTTFLFIVKVSSKSFSYKLCNFVALVLLTLDKKRYKTTIKNLKIAFPEKNDDDLKALAKQAYNSISQVLAEFLMIISGKLSKEDIQNLVVNPQEIEKLKQLQENCESGLLLIGGHFGNWELLAQYLSLDGFTTNIVAREGNNKLIDHKIIKQYREVFGNKQIYKGGAALKMAKSLKRNEPILLLIDQKTEFKNASLTQFFTQTARTSNTVAQLKLKFDPKVIPIHMVRVEQGKYKLIVEDEITYIAKEHEQKDAKIDAITQKYDDALQSIIEKYPDQWFWMHDRWKM